MLADILDDLGDRHARDLRAAGHDVDFLHLDVTDPQHWQAYAVMKPLSQVWNKAHKG